MSWKHRFFIAVLVLLNLVVYGFIAIAFSSQASRQVVASPLSGSEFAQAEISPTRRQEPTLTSTPTSTPTATRTQTPTPISPTATPSPSATPTRTRTLVPTRIRPRATRVPPPSPTISGGTVSSPLLPNGSWQTLGPRNSVWYKIGQGGYHIDAVLQANPLDGMKMEVFAPNLLDQPIGQGSLQRGKDGLVWAGGRWEKWGDWLARVVNDNPMPVQYRLSVTTTEIPACDTIGYWEYIGDNYVYWKRCK